MNKQEASKLYLDLCEPPLDADSHWFQMRGRKLEDIIHGLLAQEDLLPRTNYRPDGEEIDGSFIMDSRVFLLEAKWHSKPIDASSTYTLRGKVEGKLVGTLGVFISISGYSEKAEVALTKGKSINIILFDGYDIEYALANTNGFRIALLEKLRVAAEEGLSFYPSAKIVQKEKTIAENRSAGVGAAAADMEEKEKQRKIELAFICEGRGDQIILQEMLFRLIVKFGVTNKIRIVPAGGWQNLHKVANYLTSSASVRIVIIVDTDSQWSKRKRHLRNNLLDSDAEILPATPNLELAWLGIEKGILTEDVNSSRFFKDVARAVGNIDLENLAERDSSFRRISAMIKSLPN